MLKGDIKQSLLTFIPRLQTAGGPAMEKNTVAQDKRDTSAGIAQCDDIQEKEGQSVMDTKMKGQLMIPGRITELQERIWDWNWS